MPARVCFIKPIYYSELPLLHPLHLILSKYCRLFFLYTFYIFILLSIPKVTIPILVTIVSCLTISLYPLLPFSN